SGFLRHVRAVGDEVPIGGVLGYVSAAADTPLPGAGPSATRATGGGEGEPALISAKARQKMTELGLDPALFAGRGAVKEQDVVELAAKIRAEAARSAPAQDPRGPSTVAPLGTIQRRTARVMEESAAAIPASVLERDADFGALRARAQAIARESGAV